MDILSDMDHCTSRGRRANLNMLNTITPKADFVVDGTLQVVDIVDNILDSLKNPFKPGK